jgi:hypothetical protein
MNLSDKKVVQYGLKCISCNPGELPLQPTPVDNVVPKLLQAKFTINGIKPQGKPCTLFSGASPGEPTSPQARELLLRSKSTKEKLGEAN